jgi:hypothetical protein
MQTINCTFLPQKKGEKKGYARQEFSYDELYLEESLQDANPAKEAKGFVLVDKKGGLTSLYLDTNGNGKLNKQKTF